MESNLQFNNDLSYLAGYFDGEGCISFGKVRKGAPYLKIAVTTGDEVPIQKFCLIFGGKLNKPSFGVNRQLYSWYAHGKRAQEILRVLSPFLLAKRAQAELALTLKYEGYGCKVSKEERHLRFTVAEKVSELNNPVSIQ